MGCGIGVGINPGAGAAFRFYAGGPGAFVLWAVLIVKALQGEMLKLPLVGELAERQSSLQDYA
jgi:uncharacterized membrane protein